MVDDPPSPPPTKLLLAVHHDRYRQLLWTFLAWKRRVQMHCVRRKRVAAACRVGSVFCQRVFWTKWREFVNEKRQLREATRLEQEMENDSSTIDVFDDSEEKEAVQSASEEEDRDEMRENAAIMLRKRFYFKRWRLMIKPEVNRRAGCADGVVRIRSLHAIRRWRGFVRLKKDRTVLQQRAYFFLYYWLLKRSITRLGQQALIKKRERAVFVKIVKASRQRLLVKTMQTWRLRLCVQRTLRLWRSYIRQKRQQTLLYQPLANALARKTHHRLLQLTFDVWEKQHTRNQAISMLVTVVDRQLYRKVCQWAWRIWNIKVHQLTQLDSFQRGCQERRMKKVWEAWSARAKEKGRQEQLRRRAVRAHYMALLRRGLIGFQAWHAQRQLALNRVGVMQSAADARIMASAFSRWDHFTSKKKTRALKCERALLHFESRLLKYVWVKGFRCFFTRALAKKRLELAAQKHHASRVLKNSFCSWKNEWQAAQSRDAVLSKMLQDYTVTKQRAMKSVVLENWSEFTRAKAAKRVVNAQLRGMTQRRILKKHLSQWITYISLLRWQQITCARADQHYKGVLLKKCFERWQHNVNLRQRYRIKTRAALVHWKLILQRKVFDRWKLYMLSKKEKQQRIHEALEFRHQEFVRDGLRHWITAAVHLQELREQQVVRAQATSTAQIWHRVASIARHWRYLTVRRRINGEQTHIPEPSRRVFRAQDDLNWLSEHQPAKRARDVQPLRFSPEGVSAFRFGSVPAEEGEHSNWMNERSPLSEFVLLPRNRPQPRRPIEVLLFAEADTENLSRANEKTRVNEALRCGFELPVEPSAPLSPPPPPDIGIKPPHSSRMFLPRERFGRIISGPSVSTMPPKKGNTLAQTISTAKQLDILEQQLLALSQRKKEWKRFQQQLDVLRQDADSNPQSQLKLRYMEDQFAVRTKQWLHTKSRIRLLATQIQELRTELQR